MEHIDPNLYEDYLRWTKSIGDDPYVSNNCVGIIDVLKAHYLIIDYFFKEYGEGVGGIGPRNLNILHSTLSRQHSAYEGVRKWRDNFEICATLFYGLIKNHPFHDVNKRTAFLVLVYHLSKIRRFPNSKNRLFEDLAIRIASKRVLKNKSELTFSPKSDSIRSQNQRARRAAWKNNDLWKPAATPFMGSIFMIRS